MAVDHFCLKWNNFQTSILTAFESLQTTEDLADVTLTCEGLNIKAHKIILSACSPYFRTVFKENPCPHPIVILKDVQHLDLIAILNFMYHGEVLISQDQLPTFLQTAEMLQVSGLVSRTCNDTHPDLTAPYNQIRTARKPFEAADLLQRRAKPKAAVKSSITPVKCTETVVRDEEPTSIVDVSLGVDEIKKEADEENGDENDDDHEDNNVEENNGQNSILEAVLEVKESSSSILERSLTALNKSPSIAAAHVIDLPEHDLIIAKLDNSDVIERKGPKHKHCESPEIVNENTTAKTMKLQEASVVMKSVDSPPSVKAPFDLQPHHSSQCGNCPHCGKVYSNQSALKYHVRLVHSDLTNMYCCHLCPESFDYREGYKKHMVEIHSIRN